MKLEAGMYVRNNYFGIGKINKEYFDSNNKHWFNVKFNCYKDEDCHCGICEETMTFKASHNIIDLIEVGDILRIHLYDKIYCIVEVEEQVYDKNTKYIGVYIPWHEGSRFEELKDLDIREILTHEQYEANCYKVVE